MEIYYDNYSFKLKLDNIELINGTKDNPFIFIGRGNTAYNMHLGNFNIEDEIIEKIALTDVSVDETNIGKIVTFSRGDIYYIKLLFIEENNKLIINFNEISSDINRLWIRIEADKDEHIYGCGEQYSYFNLRGRNYPLWVREQGVGRCKKSEITFKADCLEGAGGDYHTTYFPQSVYISDKKYYLYVDNSSFMDFNFKNEAYHEIQVYDIPDRIIISKENSFIELLNNLTWLLGRQINLPSWVYNGVWLGMQGGTDTILSKLNNAVSKGLKVGAIWAQDWEGKRITYFGKRLMWNWQWDEKLYPNLNAVIKELDEKGIKFLGYINPYLAIEGNLFKEASKLGYLVKNRNGEDYITDMGAFMAGHIDLTNKDAFDWYKGVIKNNMIGLGLKGWMADFGEYLPCDACLHNGVAAQKMHNMWPVLWAKCNREAIEEEGKLGEIVFFMRSGYTGAQKYNTMMWSGDQNVDWSLDDGLPSVIVSALSLGMSGFGLMHSDIGGYTTLFGMKRTKELFQRWVELGTFAPIMRTHEGNRPDDNWQFDSDDETLLHFARMSNIYKVLALYTNHLVNRNSESGIPVIRPMFLHYENDRRCYDIQDQFLYGRDLLVAPIIEEGKAKRNVYLPKDEWIHLWTLIEYSEGVYEIDAPIGYPPVFFRKNSDYDTLFKEISKL